MNVDDSLASIMKARCASDFCVWNVMIKYLFIEHFIADESSSFSHVMQPSNLAKDERLPPASIILITIG